MSQPAKRPDEVFCIECGPGTILDADPRAQWLRCLRCVAESWLPRRPGLAPQRIVSRPALCLMYLDGYV